MTACERELEADNARLRATVTGLQDLVADLRRQLERQQLTIDRLTRIAFGPSSERFAGPTHTGSAPSSPESSSSRIETDPNTDDVVSAAETAGLPRRGRHGRRRPTSELSVERVVIDLGDTEKPCPCCGEVRVRVGLSEPSRRYDYRPAAVFIRETVRVSYACRRCERAGRSPSLRVRRCHPSHCRGRPPPRVYWPR